MADSIALVHIGDKLPTYLDDALAQIRSFNKNCPLYLLVSEKVFPLLETSLKNYSLSLVALEKLQKTP